MADAALRAEALAIVEVLSDTELDNKIKFRGIDHIPTAKLDPPIACYERKIPIIKEELLRIAIAKQAPELFPNVPVDREESLIAKRDRLLDKLACCLKEIEFRKDGKVSRVYHGTTYYIDLDGGNDGNTGLSTIQSWLTIEQYTTTTVRTAGDIAKVRANTDEIVAADIQHDEDGDADDLIEVRGCSSTDDPWGDASDVLPIIDFNSNNASVYLYTDNFWRYYRMEVKNSSTDGFELARNAYVQIDSCDINSNDIGIDDGNWCLLVVKNSTIESNASVNINTLGNVIILDTCTLNGGGGNSYGIDFATSTTAYMVDCSFGQTVAHGTRDMRAYRSFPHVYARNCIFEDADPLYIPDYGGLILSEDHNQTFENQYGYWINGTIEEDTVITLDGQMTAKMTPSSVCGVNSPMMLGHNVLTGAYRLWLTAGAYTVTIKARETAAWTADPTSSQFFFRASYLSNAGTAARSTIDSAQSLNGVNEVSFTMAFTSLRDGWVYIQCFLGAYELGKSVNVSLVVSVA